MKGKPRTCAKCGKRYHRRNLIEGWDKTNPGHREGWNKTKLKICTSCMNPAEVTGVLRMARVSLVTIKKVGTAKRKVG